MTKEQARDILETHFMLDSDIHLPVIDEKVCTENRVNEQGQEEVIDWTFIGLIKLIYDL